MSNPYIQVEIDATKKMPLLASALGIQLREAAGGLQLMWTHAYNERTNEVGAVYLRAFFGIEPRLAGDVLCEMGFLARIGDSLWRIKGAGRYTRLSDARREAGKKGGQASVQAKRQKDEQSLHAPEHPQADVKQNAPADAVAQAKNKQTGTSAKQNAPKAKQKEALEPITDISLPSGERDINAKMKSGDAPGQPALGGAGTGAAVTVEASSNATAPSGPAPNRPPDPGESWESFAARYPWPTEPSLGLLEPPVAMALMSHAKANGRAPLALLTELVEREVLH